MSYLLQASEPIGVDAGAASALLAVGIFVMLLLAALIIERIAKRNNIL